MLLHIIMATSSPPPFSPSCVFEGFFLAAGLDERCLTGKIFHSAWECVWFQLDFEGSVFSPLWSSLSNNITLFYLLWCWHLLFSSFSLLVLFLQLRCQADKQGKLCKWCLKELWLDEKKKGKKKMLWQYLAKAGWFKKKSISFYQLTSEPCTGSPVTQQLLSFAPQARDMKHRLEALRSGERLSQEQPILAHQGYQQNTTTTSLLAKQTNAGNGHSYLGTYWLTGELWWILSCLG